MILKEASAEESVGLPLPRSRLGLRATVSKCRASVRYVYEEQFYL